MRTDKKQERSDSYMINDSLQSRRAGSSEKLGGSISLERPGGYRKLLQQPNLELQFFISGAVAIAVDASTSRNSS